MQSRSAYFLDQSIDARTLGSRHGRFLDELNTEYWGKFKVGIMCPELTVGLRSEVEPPFEPSQALSNIGFGA